MKNILLPLLAVLFLLNYAGLVYGISSVVYVNAHVSGGTTYYDLWTMDPDGGNKQRRTYLDATLMQYPSWSNDGTRILFDSDHNSGYSVNINNVFLYDLRTGVLSALTGEYSEPGSCPCGSISGRVYSDTVTNTPVPNTRVRAKGVLLPVYTDDNGFYTITNVPAQTSWVRASGTGSEWSYRDTIVTAGQATTNVNLYLSDGVFYKYHPRWSPDNARYAQESLHVMPGATTTQIESMYLDQSGKVSMNPPSSDSTIWDPDWSPLEDKLVYVGWGGGLSVRDVLVSNLDGGGRQRIVDCANPFTPCTNPEWSPDGSLIAFIQNSYSLYDTTFPQTSYLRLADSAGGSPWTLYSVSGKSGRIENPTFSPGGNQIIFDIFYPDNTANVFRIDSDGGNLLQITDDGLSFYASWSPQTPPTVTTSTVASTTTTSSTTTSTTLAGECSMKGDYPPCGEITVSEIIDSITMWSTGEADMSEVLALITAWAAG